MSSETFGHMLTFIYSDWYNVKYIQSKLILPIFTHYFAPHKFLNLYYEVKK